MKVSSVALVSRYCALGAAVIYMLIEFIFSFQSEAAFQIGIHIPKAAILALCIFLSSYFFFGKLITQRLGVIYKLIRNNRLSVPEEFEKMSPDDQLNKTEEDVREWGIKRLNNREKEELLKNYRQEFTGSIAHELKTPLFSIEGYVHTLLDGAMQDPSLTKKYLTKAADNVDRLTEIIDAMSTISKFDSGQMELDIVEFDIKALVEECIEEIRFQLESKKSKIENGGNEYSKIMVFGDRKYIRQVLINLLSNSIRYSEKKATTRVEYSEIGDQRLIEVKDEGVGIEAEHLPHVFDRFYRVDYGRSRKEGGSGIGLAIVKHIMIAHGQRVQVSSEYGKGSNFSFTLRKA